MHSPSYSGAGAGAGGGDGSVPPAGALGPAGRAPGLLSRSLVPRAARSSGKEPRTPSSLVNPRMASMLCSREVLPPGLRSRWPASEKLPSAMAGAQPGRCMGGAGAGRTRPALSALQPAQKTASRGSKSAPPGATVQPEGDRTAAKSRERRQPRLRALEAGERRVRGRLGPGWSWSSARGWPGLGVLRLGARPPRLLPSPAPSSALAPPCSGAGPSPGSFPFLGVLAHPAGRGALGTFPLPSLHPPFTSWRPAVACLTGLGARLRGPASPRPARVGPTPSVPPPPGAQLPFSPHPDPRPPFFPPGSGPPLG